MSKVDSLESAIDNIARRMTGPASQYWSESRQATYDGALENNRNYIREEIIKGLKKPENEFPEMVDITAPSIVGVEIRHDGKVLWVNVDGVCRLRCCLIGELILEDNQPKRRLKKFICQYCITFTDEDVCKHCGVSSGLAPVDKEDAFTDETE
jgi:hypothetical protein